jgi:hypothetical protein
MSLNSTQLYIQGLVQGLQPPGGTGIQGPVEALITPYDPDESGLPRIYVWPSNGPESRLAWPRNTGPGTPAGWKQTRHSVQLFLVWFDDSDADADIDINFPALIDYVMFTLRTCTDPAPVTDPFDGSPSWLLDIGEDMTYEYVPPRSTADQRMLRYDAKITCPVTEYFQA